MSPVNTVRFPSGPTRVSAPWRVRTPAQALPWRSLASLGLAYDCGAEGGPGAGGDAPGAPGAVESAPVASRFVCDHRLVPQEA